jgi:hypothetical protein
MGGEFGSYDDNHKHIHDIMVDRVIWIQNGKQGEMKSLGAANASAMADAAGQEAK